MHEPIPARSQSVASIVDFDRYIPTEDLLTGDTKSRAS